MITCRSMLCISGQNRTEQWIYILYFLLHPSINVMKFKDLWDILGCLGLRTCVKNWCPEQTVIVVPHAWVHIQMCMQLNFSMATCEQMFSHWSMPAIWGMNLLRICSAGSRFYQKGQGTLLWGMRGNLFGHWPLLCQGVSLTGKIVWC